MKKIALLLILLLANTALAQIQNIDFEIKGSTKSFTLIVDKKQNLYQFTLQDKDATVKKEFSMQNLSLDNFILLFKGNIKVIDDAITEYNATAKAIEVYSIAVNNNEKGPIAGKLIISKNVNAYYLKPGSSKEIEKNTLKIISVSIVIEQGFIQDIKINGTWNKIKLSFTNQYGIGFTSKKNYPDLKRIRLFVGTVFGDEKGVKNPNSLKLDEKYKFLYVYLGDIIKYDRQPELYTNDFSPADISETCKGGQEIILYKEPTFKLFEGKVFTDLAGFNADNPNGLIQIEVEKKVNYNTRRFTFFHPAFRAGIGFFEYLKPYGGYSKFEDTNKFLVPDMKDEPATTTTTVPTNILINNRYTTSIDILRHQVWRIGTDINITTLDMPLLKSKMFIDGGFSYASSAIRDSIRTYKNPTLTADILTNSDNIKSVVKEYHANYWQFYPTITWQYIPQLRYGFSFIYKPSYFYLNNEQLNLKGKADQITENRRSISKWINEFEICAFWKLDANGKLFFRWRLNSEMGYSNNYYNQIQVGYSFNILGNK